jgi:hypothetical protein
MVAVIDRSIFPVDGRMLLMARRFLYDDAAFIVVHVDATSKGY